MGIILLIVTVFFFLLAITSIGGDSVSIDRDKYDGIDVYVGDGRYGGIPGDFGDNSSSEAIDRTVDDA